MNESHWTLTLSNQTRIGIRFPPKAGRAGRFSRAVWVGPSHHVRGGGAVLLPVGASHQTRRGEGRDRPDPDGLPHTVHLLLGASDLML